MVADKSDVIHPLADAGVSLDTVTFHVVVSYYIVARIALYDLVMRNHHMKRSRNAHQD